jgi:enoyl-CoA hydratase
MYDLSDRVLVEADGPVRIVTLNRPDRYNAVDVPLHRDLATIWSRIAADREVRAVVLTGAGNAFCAGGDRELIRDTVTNAAERYATVQEAKRIVTEMIAFPIPLIAAVNGPAVGLGCSLALLSDIVLMSSTAYFSDPHVSIGLVAADGGALAWPAYTSLLRAKEYILTGDRIDAATAERIGLANRVVGPEELIAAASALAHRLARQPRQALFDTKRALNIHLNRAVTGVIDFAFAAESESFAIADFPSGRTSDRTR